jgi:hypothetical protein
MPFFFSKRWYLTHDSTQPRNPEQLRRYTSLGPHTELSAINFDSLFLFAFKVSKSASKLNIYN